MASSQPIIRQVKGASIIVQFIVLAFFIYIFYLVGTDDPLLFGAIVYLLISLTIRNLIPKHHRRGVRLYKNGQYEKAIGEFEKSYEFFSKNHWIDKYRYIVLLSSSRITYLEMAMVNMAFCYGQIGNGLKSKELYQKTLELFPDSKIAKSALKIYDAAKEL